MNVEFLATVAVIAPDAPASRKLYVDALGLPLESHGGGDYHHSEQIDGCKSFGIWPLSQAAEACFGTSRWPAARPVPQVSIEFDVVDAETVGPAAQELENAGYELLHQPREEPWGQIVARLQSPEGAIVGISYTPVLHGQDAASPHPVPVDFEEPSWEADKYPGRHVAPVGAQAGAEELAANVYELDPGAVGSPLHVHNANEELLLVLAGTLSLRSPDATQLLSAGAVVAFPRGQAGAHSLVNSSDAPVRYLVVSTANRPDVVEYPDTAARLIVLAEQRLAYPHGSDVDQRPVVEEAMRAAADRDA